MSKVRQNKKNNSSRHIEHWKPIIILDLDNTIIGNIIEPELKQNISIFNILINEFNNSNIYYKLQSLQAKLTFNSKPSILDLNSTKHSIFSNKCFNKVNKYFTLLLKNGLLRPYFKNFIDFIKKYNFNVFIYTAASPLWAKFMIYNIEKLIKFKFNEPLFTRDDMVIKNGYYYKSINYIKPIIFKSLNNNSPEAPKARKHSLLNNNNASSVREHSSPLVNKLKILMIDNKNDVILEKKYLYKCPDYEYTAIINIRDFMTNKNLAHFLSINNKTELLEFIKIYNNKIEILKNEYKIKSNISTYKYDSFWKDIIIIIKKKYNITNNYLRH